MFLKLAQSLSDTIKTPFSLKLPDGKEIKFGEQYGPPLFQVDVKTQKALRAIKSGDELKIAESYIYGDIDLNGAVDMLKFLEIKNLFAKNRPIVITWLHFIAFFTKQVTINRESIAQHYEFDSEFFLMFLDQTRSYSQALFATDDEPHADAAQRKLQYAFDSCHLVPGANVLDIGAGWGNVVEFLGTRGVNVDAVTIANKSEQFITKLINDKKLSQCQIFKIDFLDYQPPAGKHYDAITSLGTLEHLPNYKLVLQRCAALLRKGGYAYFDSSAKIAGFNDSYFIERHIFPGNHELLDIYRFLEAVKSSGFELIAVHNDTHNYYLTLKHWAENLDQHKEEIIKRWGLTHYRKFQLYLWGCTHNMLNNELQAYRVVLRKL